MDESRGGGAEGKTCIDFDSQRVGRYPGAIVAAVDQEAPGAHRRPGKLGARDPIVGLDPFDT